MLSTLVAAVAVATATAAGLADEPLGVRPEALPGSASSFTWRAPQFIQADRQGRIFLLRADTLEVFPVTPAGKLEEPAKLEALPKEGFAHRAAMGSSSGDWLVLLTAGGPRLFTGGQERKLPDLEWVVNSVGMLRGEPVLGVLGRGGQGIRLPLTASTWKPTPLILMLVGDRWSSLVMAPEQSSAAPPPPQSARAPDAIGQQFEQDRGERSVLLAGDQKGRLWAAHEYAYHLEEFGASGKKRTDLRVAGAPIRQVEGKEKAQREKKFAERVRASGAELKQGTVALATALRNAVWGLVVGRDGRVYVVAEADSKNGGDVLVLDRYDAARELLERVRLNLPYRGMFSMAAGRDALYLAGFAGTAGRWRIPWDELESANWTTVEGVTIR